MNLYKIHLHFPANSISWEIKRAAHCHKMRCTEWVLCFNLSPEWPKATLEVTCLKETKMKELGIGKFLFGADLDTTPHTTPNKLLLPVKRSLACLPFTPVPWRSLFKTYLFCRSCTFPSPLLRSCRALGPLTSAPWVHRSACVWTVSLPTPHVACFTELGGWGALVPFMPCQ